MTVHRIDHFTLRVDPADLDHLRHFYTTSIGLTDGPRPQFAFPGHWLYAGDRAVVHLAGLGADTLSTEGTGRLDHIAFAASGLEASRARLRAAKTDWREAPVPGTQLHQIFLTDPGGLALELTFDLAQEAELTG